MDSSALLTTSQEQEAKSSTWGEEIEESELDTEDESVMDPAIPRRSQRPRWQNMHSEGSWSAMSDRDPMKAFRHLMGSLLGPSPVGSPTDLQKMAPRLSKLGGRSSRGNSPRASARLLSPSAASGHHRRDSTLAAFRQLVGMAMLRTPNGGAMETPQLGGKFNFPRRSARMSPRSSLIAPSARGHRRDSTMKAFKQLAGSLLGSPSSRRTSAVYSSSGPGTRSRKGTLLATPSGHGRDDSTALFDAIVGALVRLKTATPRSKHASAFTGNKKRKKKLKLVWVDESDDEDMNRLGVPKTRRQQSEADEVDDESDASVLPVGAPDASEQKPSHQGSGLLTGSRLSDDEESVLPVDCPDHGDEQKPSAEKIPSAHIDLEPKLSLSGKPSGSRGSSAGMKTIRVINLKNAESGESCITDEAACSSCARLGDVDSSTLQHSTMSISRRGESKRTDTQRTNTTQRTDHTTNSEILLRLIDLHSKQMELESEAHVSPYGSPFGSPMGTADEDLIMRLSQFANSMNSPAPQRAELPSEKRPLRRQNSDLGATSSRKKRRSRSFQRMASEPTIRLHPLINPKTKQAGCSIM